MSCQFHCRSCDSHFSSLRAFDAHHSGGGCKDPDEIKKLVAGKGDCTHADPSAPKRGVVVYATAP